MNILQPIPTRRRAYRWMLVAPALLLFQAAISTLTVYLSVSDPSFASEPDYYRKAVEWDTQAAQQRTQAQLGWRIDLDVATVEHTAGERWVRVLLHDLGGAPILDAHVTAEAFHHARAADRRQLEFAAGEPGQYAVLMSVKRTGLWEFRVRAIVGAQVLTTTRLLDVAPAVGTDS